MKFDYRVFPSRMTETERLLKVPKTILLTNERKATENLTLDHFVRIKSRDFHGVTGIGKHFILNGHRVLTSERHPRSGIQLLLDETDKEILR